MEEVISVARETFPDAANDAQALTRALFNWYHDRESNSKRGSLNRIEAEMAQQSERIAAIERTMAEMRQTLTALEHILRGDHDL
jgi:hypothetical protein